MDILQAARQLYPGTAWILKSWKDVEGVLHRELKQAEDGTPRVEVPSLDVLDAIVSAHIPPVAPLSSEERIKQLEEQIKILLQGK